MTALTSLRAAVSTLKRTYYRIIYFGGALGEYYFHVISGGTWKSRLNLNAPKIKKIKSQKEQLHTAKRLALFAAYHPKKKASLSNLNYIKSLIECGFVVIYIHNGPLEQDALEELDLYCYQIICRENLGQDFGAWKDSIKLCENCNLLEGLVWLLLCNDSNFFLGQEHSKHFENNFKIALQSNDYDLIAANKNLEAWSHYQSFFLCFHHRLFCQKSFEKFWQSYAPLSHRYHTINNGEIKLSRTVIKDAKAFVMFDPPKLFSKIIQEGLSIEDLTYLPMPMLQELDPSKIGQKSRINFIALCQLLSHLESFNPSHVLALLSVKYLMSPFLKKDLYRNGVYSLTQIAAFLEKQGIQHESEIYQSIASHFLNTGSNNSYVNLPKEAFRKGVPMPLDPYSVRDKRMKSNLPKVLQLGSIINF